MYETLSMVALFTNALALTYVVYLRKTKYQFTVRIRFVDDV
jgi:hypothetical protein